MSLESNTDGKGEVLAGVTCTECERRRPFRGETWQLRFADIGEVAIYCPLCAAREFGADERPSEPLH